MMQSQPLPIEQTDPGVGQFIQNICNKKKPYGITGIFEFDQGLYFRIEAQKKQEIRRNDPCGCGSGKKYKKCCGK